MPALRFHWMLVKGGEGSRRMEHSARIMAREFRESGLPDLENRAAYCREAERRGIDSVLMSFGYYEPDTIVLATALGLMTERLKFIVAYRSGLLCPTSFVQQINTASGLVGGRISLNIVAGHSPEEQRYYGDFLPHEERYRRTDEFLTICRSFWNTGNGVAFDGRYYRVEEARLGTPFVSKNRSRPEIYVGGHSESSRTLAAKHADCWLRMADAPESLRPVVEPMLERGKEVGLRLGIIARPTRREALEHARFLIRDQEMKRKEVRFMQGSDSESFGKGAAAPAESDKGWLSPCLWAGAVPYYGAPAVSLVGTPEEIAEALIEYRNLGITQFILHGWPKLEELVYFSEAVLPLVRVREASRAG